MTIKTYVTFSVCFFSSVALLLLCRRRRPCSVKYILRDFPLLLLLSWLTEVLEDYSESKSFKISVQVIVLLLPYSLPYERYKIRLKLFKAFLLWDILFFWTTTLRYPFQAILSIQAMSSICPVVSKCTTQKLH